MLLLMFGALLAAKEGVKMFSQSPLTSAFEDRGIFADALIFPLH